MSEIFRNVAKHLRPGLYLLDHPVRLPSVQNFWEEADLENGDCEPEDVGTPIMYELHAVRVRNEIEWYGHDEPSPENLNDRQRVRLIPKEDSAVVFSPEELHPLELVRFLQRARRVRT